ncbi:hypothetical protein HC766_03355 [Candidatus Gracilibacteria bacterium]|nr:hypothetical protein [Thermales bacterium]NJL96758.1 hypothetical protein [Candidatus Gracilibacteria bacterium]NJS41389.1 hypothetical protein [Candidatus Gracilibacteria bacterium]
MISGSKYILKAPLDQFVDAYNINKSQLNYSLYYYFEHIKKILTIDNEADLQNSIN